MPRIKHGIQKSSQVTSNKSKHISVKELWVTALTQKQQVFCTARPVILDLFVWKRAKCETRTLAPLRLYSLYVEVRSRWSQNNKKISSLCQDSMIRQQNCHQLYCYDAGQIELRINTDSCCSNLQDDMQIIKCLLCCWSLFVTLIIFKLTGMRFEIYLIW